MNIEILKATAKNMVANGKGILAVDESAVTCGKRFDAVGVPSTEQSRHAYREMIITASGLEEYISGIILHDETLRQNTESGVPFTEILSKKGILPGIKVDAGPKDLALHNGEKVTEGLDGLRERLAEYKALGARFAKWRAVITIGADIPSDACLYANAHALARYAALCQEVDIVPMIEPEVLIDGDQTIERSFEVTAVSLKQVFTELQRQDVMLEGVILKTSMVIAGTKATTQSSVAEVAEATLRCLKENVPANIGGIVFLSGGQGDEQATTHLNAMNSEGSLPWPLSFSYARAIQNPVLKIWAQNPATNIASAQQVLLFRSKMNSLATQGKYSDALEKDRMY